MFPFFRNEKMNDSFKAKMSYLCMSCFRYLHCTGRDNGELFESESNIHERISNQASVPTSYESSKVVLLSESTCYKSWHTDYVREWYTFVNTLWILNRLYIMRLMNTLFGIIL